MLKVKELDQETIKDSNKKKILNLLCNRNEITKQEISKETGISIPTVINNINELIKEGIVEEAGVAISSGGRKPIIINFIPDSRYSFGVDITIDYVKIILINLKSQIKYAASFSRKEYGSFKEVLDKANLEIQRIIALYNISRDKILGIGFSLPGTVNEEMLLLETAPNIGVKNYEFKSFERNINIPVYIENEANAAALAELSLGIVKDKRNLVYISITHGIGTGIVIYDHLYKGKNKRAGEFGHMTVVPGGKQCNCGRKGCWELYASDKALIENYNAKSEEKISSLSSFFEFLKTGDKLAREVWETHIYYLALGIQNIILALDPHYVIIGGEISNYDEILISAIKEKIFIDNIFYCKEDIEIVASKFKGDSSVLGAALLPLQKMFSVYEIVI